MRRRACPTLAAVLLLALCPGRWAAPRFGGDLVAALHSDPKTLNPVTALDLPSQTVIGLINGDLIHTNRYTQQIEPALATRWTVRDGGRRYILHLRRGVGRAAANPGAGRDKPGN